jgi:hypothetical protein
MPKRREVFADALSRLIFDKPLAELDPAERAELNFLRALEVERADEARYEELARTFQDRSEGHTIH